MKRFVLLLLAACVLAGCAARRPAPVIERAPVAARPPAPPAPVVQAVPATAPGTYTVRRGDTLYSIALDNGLDYRDLAAWNNIGDANVIREGQVLNLKGPPSDIQVRPIAGAGGVQVRPLGEAVAPRPAPADALVTEPKAVKLPYSEQNLSLLAKPSAPPVAPPPEPKAVTPAPQVKPEPPAKAEDRANNETDDDALAWSWPASGKVLAGFSDPSNKGLDIGGRKGEPVTASAGGRVVYIGEGLRGYGKLVIIKHNNTYLSAYAHNDAILVKEGQTVVKGQKIAEIGSTGTDQTKLHFEIRRLGKPVDPLKFLPDKPS
jgi:lipoprotein NlpD